MLIKYKGGFYTLREVCDMMFIDYDDFMAWCRKHALQKYDVSLNFYKRMIYQKQRNK